MNDILKRAFLNSIGTAVYIVLVVLFIFSMQAFQDQPDNIIIPIAMLLLFVCSAGITGFLVFGKPIMLYIDGKKKEAVLLLGYTLAILFLITLIAFVFLINYLRFS